MATFLRTIAIIVTRVFCTVKINGDTQEKNTKYNHETQRSTTYMIRMTYDITERHTNESRRSNTKTNCSRYRIRPNYRTYPYKRTVKKFRSLQITTSVLFSLLLYKGICCGYSFELHRQVDAIQMSTHNICLCKESQKKSQSHH